MSANNQFLLSTLFSRLFITSAAPLPNNCNVLISGAEDVRCSITLGSVESLYRIGSHMTFSGHIRNVNRVKRMEIHDKNTVN